jgi:ABC-type sugar transport system permease subunit
MEFTLFRSLFWIPPVSSSVMLFLGWRGGLIQRPGVVAACWGVALALQGFSGLFSPTWTIGLVLQVGVAVYLGVMFTLP